MQNDTMVQQAKMADIASLGFGIVYGGSYYDITVLETGDTERVFLGEGNLMYFQLGIIMERYRNKCATKTPTRRKRGTTNAQSAEKPKSGAGTQTKPSGKPPAASQTPLIVEP